MQSRVAFSSLIVVGLIASLWPVSLRSSLAATAEPNTPGGRRGRGMLPQTSPDPNAAAYLQKMGDRGVGIHDPSTIVKCKDEYWVFYTGRGVPSYHSRDLVKWQRGPEVITTAPEWLGKVVPPGTGRGGPRGGMPSFWAPDVIRLGDRYLVYFSYSTFGKNTSAIALATNPTLDPCDPQYKWTEQGIVIQSDPNDNFNSIDPAVTTDAEGNLWMAFGSFWSGIKLVQLDPRTGKRLSPDSPIHSLARHGAADDPIEAACVYPHNGLYYLFVNWDRCCQGANSTYNIRVGRSIRITGPYLDKQDKDMLSGGGTLVAGGDGVVFVGPGHAGIIKVGDKYWMGMHYYDGSQRGISKFAIRPLTWTRDGWPIVGVGEPSK
jgi:arabinan endo-1,5-alpha-L-arabinosidase